MTKLFAAAAALMIAPAAANAAIVVDGTLDAAYGASTATVGYDPAGPNGNFDMPASSANPGYTVHIKGDNGFVYIFLQADHAFGGNSFANAYFDIDPSKNDGADIIVGVNGNGGAYAADFSSPMQMIHTLPNLQVAMTATTFEFAIPNSVFSVPIAGFNYYGNANPQVGDTVVFRGSQSLGYTYVGGSSFGPTRLGSTVLQAAAGVPEPATWGMMIAGMGALGAASRRRRRVAANFAA